MGAYDRSLEILLDLDGEILVVDPETGYWVKFVAQRVPVTRHKPHGLNYSLTLHAPDGRRLLGFDNAHPIPGVRSQAFDHRHRVETVQSYEYVDAGTLIVDFWTAVDAVLRDRGVIR